MLREVYKVDVEVSAPTVYEGRQAIERADRGGDALSCYRAEPSDRSSSRRLWRRSNQLKK